MSSPFFSELAKLDNCLQAVQSQVKRMRAGLEVDEAQLKLSVEEARQHAATLRDRIRTENANASWTDREALEDLILALEIAADERRVQLRRAKLLELARELETGSVKHRVSARAVALNGLRLDAVGQLRAEAARPEQDKELAGPEASQWMHWVCNLTEETDAPVLAKLRNDFPAVEAFAVGIEESFWEPGEPLPETATPESSTAEPARPASLVSAGLGRLPHDVRAQFDKAMQTGDFNEALLLCYDPPSGEILALPETSLVSEATTSWQPDMVAVATAPLPQPEVAPPALKYCEQCGRTYPNRYKVCPFDGAALGDLPDAVPEIMGTASPAPDEAVAAYVAEASVSEAEATTDSSGQTNVIPLRQIAPVQRSEDAAAPEVEIVTPDSSPELTRGVAPNFDELVLSKRPVPVWIAAAILVVVGAVFVWMHYFRSPASPVAAQDSQIQVAQAAANADPSAGSASNGQPVDPSLAGAKALLHRQPSEGAQQNILLSMEQCARTNPAGVECWGYISNQRDKDSQVSLARVDVVDGKGNSFDLTGKGQTSFSPTQDVNIPAQSKVKYSIKVPDSDKNVRTLTLYLDVNNPRGAEYTFRDVPISE